MIENKYLDEDYRAASLPNKWEQSERNGALWFHHPDGYSCKITEFAGSHNISIQLFAHTVMLNGAELNECIMNATIHTSEYDTSGETSTEGAVAMARGLMEAHRSLALRLTEEE